MINVNDLKAEITRNNYTINDLACELGISRSSLSRKINGITMFKQPEMLKLQSVLNLSGEKMIDIFFDQKVS